jgi:hypothetical protein
VSSWKSRLHVIYRTTRQHAFNLAKFVSIYKTLLLLQKKINGGKERNIDTFVAGLIGGYIVFGERNAVNEQVDILHRIINCGLLKKMVSLLHLDCALRRVSCYGFLHSTSNLAIQHFSGVCFGILCCKTYSTRLTLLYAVCSSDVGRCDVAIPASRRNHPTRDVQFHEIPISRLGCME